MLQTWLNLFISFAKIGLFGYGGGPSMIPLIREEAVEVRQWMTDQEFTDVLAMGNALPGPIATKMTMYIGYEVAGWGGGFFALFCMLLPSLVLMMVLALFFLRFKDLPFAKAMLTAVRPVVVALLAYTVYTVGRTSVLSWQHALIAAVAFVAVAFLNVHPALTILGGAILGLIVYR
jgi:chromate transporter